MSNLLRLALCASALLALPAAAPAADLPSSLPTLAVDPQLPPPDPWKGFYVGAGVTAAFAKGSKGGWGSEAYGGYDHVFANGILLGGRFSTGYNPFLTTSGRFQGYDFAESSVKLGYEMGRLTPFVTAGVAGLRAARAGDANPANALNGVLGGPGGFQAAGVLGAGFDYAVTDKLHVGIAAYVHNGAVAPY